MKIKDMVLQEQVQRLEQDIIETRQDNQYLRQLLQELESRVYRLELQHMVYQPPTLDKNYYTPSKGYEITCNANENTR